MSSFQIWCLAATGLKKVGTEQQRPEKAGHFENIQLWEHLATNLVNWHQVCNMISYKREVLERQSLSEVKMGRGSPICGRVRKKIVEYFKNNICHVKLQRLCKSHHLQFITPSKYSEKLDKSLCARDKRTKTANIFFAPVQQIFYISQSQNTGRPIKFEHGSREQSMCCFTKGWEWWRCFENQCKQTPKKNFPDKRREWMPNSCYCWYLRTDYILYTE